MTCDFDQGQESMFRREMYAEMRICKMSRQTNQEEKKCKGT